MKLRITAALLAVSLVAGCAHGPRHFATVSVVTAHSTLAAIQDVEMAMVCGRSTAPPAPQCVPVAKHQEISLKLATAFDLDARAARIVRALPDGAAQPADVGVLVAQVSGLVRSIMESLPQSKQTQALAQKLEAR